jgi:hypothetical protein
MRHAGVDVCSIVGTAQRSEHPKQRNRFIRRERRYAGLRGKPKHRSTGMTRVRRFALAASTDHSLGIIIEPVRRVILELLVLNMLAVHATLIGVQ